MDNKLLFFGIQTNSNAVASGSCKYG